MPTSVSRLCLREMRQEGWKVETRQSQAWGHPMLKTRRCHWKCEVGVQTCSLLLWRPPLPPASLIKRVLLLNTQTPLS
jgi:hypothetical protein